MRSCVTLICLGLLGQVVALDKFGILEVVKAFADDIIASGKGEIPSYTSYVPLPTCNQMRVESEISKGGSSHLMFKER